MIQWETSREGKGRDFILDPCVCVLLAVKTYGTHFYTHAHTHTLHNTRTHLHIPHSLPT